MRALRRLFMFILLVLALCLGASWWILDRALPQTSGIVRLDGLSTEVTVDRDTWGIPFIQASSLEDLVEAQGFVVAQDRFWQMDVLRRTAAGEQSEIFGRRTIALDRQFRTLGLRATAERDLAGATPQVRRILEAYARGVNRYIELQGSRLPWEFLALRYRPRPWSPADSLLVAGYRYDLLSRSWELKLDRAKLASILDPERAQDLYQLDSPRDRSIVGESTKDPAPPGMPHAQARFDFRPPAVWLEDAGWGSAESQGLDTDPLPAAWGDDLDDGLGSNNWVVSGAHTASGKPLLANDTHLQLGIPCIWYLAHLKAPGWNVEGFALPGVPLIFIGHNERIAWGITNNMADVQDLYVEKFNPLNLDEYLADGQWQPAEVRGETIHVRGGPDIPLNVVTTRHGPVVAREGGNGYALRWTALEPGSLLGSSYLSLGHALNWQEFREALRSVSGPPMNWVYADVDGHIAYILGARIPVRRGNGVVPVPGDAGDFEWKGYIPFEELPQVFDPPGGIIATANAKVIGPAYPYFLTERWVAPYRTERIYDLLNQTKKFRPEDFLNMQMDIVNLPGKFLAAQLIAANQTSHPSDARTGELIERLKDWDGRATADSVETAFVEYTARHLSFHLLQPLLGADLGRYRLSRRMVFLEKILTQRPQRWLPKNMRSYEALLVACADAAVKQLEAVTHSSRLQDWRWGRLMQLRMVHPLATLSGVNNMLGIGLRDQPGTQETVKQTGLNFGATMRYVADLANWDQSLMNLSTGESGQLGSAHYKDQFPVWFDGRSLPAPFSNVAEARASVHHLRLVPVSGEVSRTAPR